MSVILLPESAPFSPSQRAWLNGFFAGVLGMDGGNPGVGTEAALATLAANAEAPAAPAAQPEEFPWHDPAMSMADRLKLADGKPIERQMMAAMAQLDCGSCGYVCETYAAAIAKGEETDLTKCSPGGKETFLKLKELFAARSSLPVVEENGKAHANGSNGSNGSSGKKEANGHGSNGHATAPASPLAPKEGFSRSKPFMAPLLECRTLSKAGSEKQICFASFNLKGSGLTYEVGDALGVFPENCPDLVEAILRAMGSRGDDLVPVRDGRVVYSFEALARECTITKISDRFIRLLAETASDPSEASTLQALLGNDPDGILEAWDVLDLLEQFPSARPPIPKMIAALSTLQPRLYSISSSMKAHADEVHLTVGVVRYQKGGRTRKGVASTFLTELLRPRQKVGVFVHPSKGFRLPADGNTPIIMVGPGTGIAPFRAFLEERSVAGARGKNWLFFGDQRSGFDFLYEDELESFRKSNLLTRLDLAFSRDQDRKVYVQNRMKENGPEIWSWLQEGAHFYVCGDARRMALDVDHMLHAIVMEQGNMSEEKATEYIKAMSKAKRYQRDVY